MWFFPLISETKKIRYRAMHWLAQGHSAAEPILESPLPVLTMPLSPLTQNC